MSPENDQTRWIGIRPTNPAEDIPITLDAEVVHVIIDSGGGGDATPGKIMNEYGSWAAIVKDIWNIALEVDPGAGYLLWLAFYYPSMALNPWNVRFTIDGVVGDIINFDLFNAGSVYDYTQNRGKHLKMEFGTARYNESLKIELMNTTGNQACKFNIGYTIDNP